jgi:hypothetical protein
MCLVLSRLHPHAKNGRLYATTKKDIIFKQVRHVVVGERNKKLVEFSIYFLMLNESKL